MKIGCGGWPDSGDADYTVPMLIANPIYDTVFKYLLEDTEIAREFLGTILGQELVSIEVKPQETTFELTSQAVNIFRLDFKAVVKTAAGEHRKILIELQKAKHLLDIMRFRRYLADNYQKTDTVVLADGETASVPLPIVTIYFLGFKLAAGYPAVFKTDHQVTDVVTGKALAQRPREPFVELLTHESYVIQIPLLQDAERTQLEQLLTVFNQERRTEDEHLLSYTGEPSNPLVKKVVERLMRAVADEEMRRRMDVEDEVDNTIARLLREKDAANQALLREKDAANQALLREKDSELENVKEDLARKETLIADLRKQLDLKNQ